MSSTSIAIELLSDRMDVAAVKGGRVIESRRILIDLQADPTGWARGVRGCSDKLRAVVEELNASGARTRVVYRSPSQTVDLASFELRSAGQACAAAILPAGEALPYSASSATIKAVAVGRDASGTQRRWHVVVAADRTDVVRALVDLVDEAGLTFESATPIDAAIMSGLVQRALRHAGPQHGWLHFGKYSSFFILGGEGRIRFERSIGLGVQTIVQSLTRPIRMPDENPIQLDVDTAKEIVHKYGIPETEEVLSDKYKLTRGHIMPQIQPVLQRYVVELRQSLRFGLPEEERGSIDISVGGPGSIIPGLLDLIAWELKLKFNADEQYAHYDYKEPACRGNELADAIEAWTFLDRLNLQPPESAQRPQLGLLRRYLWSGAAAALVFVAFDGIRLQSRLSDARRESARLEAAASEARSMEKTHRKLVAAIGAVNELEKIVADTVGARANLGAVLQEVSRLTPASVRLNSMRFAREEERLTCRIYGRAEQVGAGKTEVEAFIEALKGSPIFSDASLRNVERGTVSGAPGERFEATFDTILAPDPAAIPHLASGGTDANGGQP